MTKKILRANNFLLFCFHYITVRKIFSLNYFQQILATISLELALIKICGHSCTRAEKSILSMFGAFNTVYNTKMNLR